MRTVTRIPRASVALAGAVVLLAYAGVGTGSAQAATTRISTLYLCVHTTTRAVTLATASTSCPAHTAKYVVLGSAGATGATGRTGATGARGVTGVAGPAGVAGSRGPAGPSGPTGGLGATGATGTTGVAGDEGEPGAPGAAGQQGPAGPSGTDGSVGPVGPTGSDGRGGPTGATGDTGPTGDTGSTGATGTAGTPGAPGSAGTPGEAGEHGQPGATGPTGPTGTSGASAVVIDQSASNQSVGLTTSSPTITTVSVTRDTTYLAVWAATGSNNDVGNTNTNWTCRLYQSDGSTAVGHPLSGNLRNGQISNLAGAAAFTTTGSTVLFRCGLSVTSPGAVVTAYTLELVPVGSLLTG